MYGAKNNRTKQYHFIVVEDGTINCVRSLVLSNSDLTSNHHVKFSFKILAPVAIIYYYL